MKLPSNWQRILCEKFAGLCNSNRWKGMLAPISAFTQQCYYYDRGIEYGTSRIILRYINLLKVLMKLSYRQNG